MRPKLLKAFRPDGTVRAVWDDQTAPSFRAAGVMPRRASRVEVIEPHFCEKKCGLFHVDFTPLAEATGDDRYRVCLAVPFYQYAAAVAAEVRWLQQNWVLAPAGDSRGPDE